MYDFAAAQFDQGLYRLARKEFDLTERPLRIATPDERPIRVPIERYYRDLAGPMVILGEPGTGKTTLLYELVTALLPEGGHDDEPVPVAFDLADGVR